MTAFDNAAKFFHACESLEGWDECKQYVAPGATFSAQSEPLVDVATVQGYVDWMTGLGSTTLAGCSYDLHSSSYDAANKTAVFFATFHGTHVGDGGPIPPAGPSALTRRR